jgi:hypothetical protein
MSSTIFKSIDSYNIFPFKSYKQWTFTNSDITQYSSSVNEIIFVSRSLDTNVGTNASGFNKRTLFDTIHRAFYYSSDFPLASYGRLDGEQKNLYNRASVVSIGREYFGERIKPGSISITDTSTGSISIQDDYNGNLYDTNVTNLVPSGNLVGYWNFDDAFVVSSNTAQVFALKNSVRTTQFCNAYKTYFSSGVFNGDIRFSGISSSFAVVQNHPSFNFRNYENYAVSLWVNIPTSQSVSHGSKNSIIEKWNGTGGYPFAIRTYNQADTTNKGRIEASTHDGSSRVIITTTSSFNDGLYHHLVYQKTGSQFELYVDALRINTGSLSVLGQIHNKSDLYLGGQGVQSSSLGTMYAYSGSIDELRIYNGSLTQSQISSLYTRPSNTNIVGNVFYSHGILVFTNLSGSYANLMLDAFTMTYRSTITIREHEVLVSAKSSEFNMTLNPSTYVGKEDSKLYANFVTSSLWNPYVTTIGLYNDNLQLVAIGKLTKPVKKYADLPLIFAVRFDE